MSYNTKKLSGYSGSATEVNLPSAIGGVLISAIASDVFTGKGVTKLTIDLPQSKVDQTGTPWGASSVVYNTYSITCSLTNVTGRSTNPTIIKKDEPVTMLFDANSGYNLPDSVTVTGASYTWTKGTGTLILSNPTGNVSVIIEGTAKPTYNITTSLTNVTGAAANPTTIVQGGSVNLTFTSDSGYELPDTITVSGASYTWTKGTGLVVLSNPTGAVSITIVGSAVIIVGDTLCFTANQDNSTVKISVKGTPTLGQNFRYSTDKSNWITYIPDTTGVITLANAGDKIYFRGNNPNGVSESGSIYYQFVMTGSIAASGNIMGLIDNGACTTVAIPNYRCFYRLFMSCSSLTTAPELPATTLLDSCYAEMFRSCSSLTEAPSLPASIVKSGCYSAMFYGCTSLSLPPVLSSTELGDSCYSDMFGGCSSLTTPPALPATTLFTNCYNQMFAGCTALTSVPALPATTLATWCYLGMFMSCTSLYVSDSSVSGTCEQAWRIPTSGTVTSTGTKPGSSMFSKCLGTRSSNDMAGAEGQSYTYYTQNTPIA